MQNLGKYIFVLGILLAVCGLVVWLLGNKLNWLGKLPGDIRIEKENVRIYIPFTTMLIVSIVVSLLIWLVRKIIQ